MRPERLYLSDIVEAAAAIAKFLDGVQEQEFLENDLLRSAALQKLTVIGEAAARLSAEFCEGHPGIPWRDIVGFRNIAIHAYFAVEWPIVWVAATEEAPALGMQVAEILAREFGE
ncbi:MAG TPA: HepT-like ribonuclease domain-containing protein [Thermoanaerobaculia bacterium]|nr:HepT-like ribonuclease domain-containing protein [Thermoanaerobaculia bacterium]